MWEPWKPDESYSFGARVTYNGQTYVRSIYPPTATGGTPPNEEMSVDDKSDPIRTWTIDVNYEFFQPRFNTVFFYITSPPINSETGQDEYSYASGAVNVSNAYGPIGLISDQERGVSAEYGQYQANPEPNPDSPEIPAEYCGVAMQRINEFAVAYADVFRSAPGSNLYNVFVLFNHPLYFRRTLTILSQIVVVTTVFEPFSRNETYENTYTDYVPDDRNFTDDLVFANYYIPENVAFTINVPEDIYTENTSITYNLTRLQIYQATPND